MNKKYFVLFTSFLVFVSGHLIEWLDGTLHHISHTFLTDIYAFILFLSGIIYFMLCQIDMDQKKEKLINWAIFYTVTFPLLYIQIKYLDNIFDIELLSFIPDWMFTWGINIFVAVQLFASAQLLLFFIRNDNKSIV